MFDNIGTALVQAIGFFGVFGYFVYQLLSDGKKPIDNQSKSPVKKVNQKYDLKDSIALLLTDQLQHCAYG